jgi:hypothetical protein
VEAALDDNEDDLEDSAASLMKTKAMEEGEEVCDPSSVKKNINFDEVNPSDKGIANKARYLCTPEAH